MGYHLFQLRTEYSFLSQQSAMSVRKRAGFLSPNQISELFLGAAKLKEQGHRATP